MQTGVSWCNLVHFGVVWCILVTLGPTWCNLVELGATWCSFGRDWFSVVQLGAVS